MKIILIALLPFLLVELSTAQNKNNESTELQQLKSELAAAHNDTTLIRIYVEIGIYFNSATNSDSALVYGLKAEQLSKQYPHHFNTPRVWNTIAISYSDLYDNTNDTILKSNYFKLSEKYFKKCIDEAKKTGNDRLMMHAWYNLGFLYKELPNKYTYFHNRIGLLNHLQKKEQWNSFDSLLLIKTYKQLCIQLDYEIDGKKFDEYLTQLKKIIPKKLDNDYEDMRLLSFEKLAMLSKKKDEKKILEEYQIYKKEFQSIARKDVLEIHLALYYFTIQEYEKSLQIVTDFYPQNYNYEKNGYVFNSKLKSSMLGDKYRLMGLNTYMLNRNSEAIYFLKKAIAYINLDENTMDMENEKYTSLFYLGKAYKKAGRYREALACNEQADVLYKQMHDVGIQALMAENDVNLEEIKQEKKLQEARTQTLLKEQEVEIQKKQKYTFLAFSILALLSAAWAVYSFIKTRKQNKIIQKQAVALAESNQLKDKIFALLSHDLRSPINRLVMSLNQSIESQRSAIQSELKGVQDILNNILYWASMQLKGITPINRELPLKALVDSIENEYHVILKDKNITFLNSIDSKLIIKTDENYLKIIIRNLISNAIKFTEQTGYIQIYCKENEDNLEIGLKDTGIGIPAEKLKNIYNYPESSPGTRHETGNGIGLSLSMEIAKKLNGILKINSIEQKGTVVQLILNKKLSS